MQGWLNLPPLLNPNDFEILDQLGSGSFGSVFKALRKGTNEYVGIKFIDCSKKEDISSIFQEIQIQYYLNHERIARVYGYYEEGDNICMVMEYLDSGSVDRLPQYQEKQPMPLDDVRTYMRDLAEALQYVHDKAIIHRDVKPGNMLLDKDGRVKLCDFGLAVPLDQVSPLRRERCGTLNYMAPEVQDGKSVSRACDVWSFGVVLYKLVCGEHPFKADTKEEYMEKSKSVSYKIPSSVNPIVADLISNCIKSRPESRFTIVDILNHRFFNPEPYIEPLRCPFNDGVVQICQDGNILLDMNGHSTILRILSGFQNIDIVDKSNPSRFKRYPIRALPQKYHKRYRIAVKIAEEAQSKKPLAIWNNVDGGKYIMFGDYKISFLFNGKEYSVKDSDPPWIRSTLMNVIDIVRESPQPRWPIILGTSQ